MKILPDVLRPPRQPVSRRHQPAKAVGEAGYQRYRNCLRWDFGFTCLFCLLHESDLIPPGTGVEGTGLTSIEHRAIQRDFPSLRNIYENCLYACRFCNGARSVRPERDDSGSRLLDPTREAWAGHFSAAEDHLMPRPGDRDALYTCGVYDLNDARKVQLRSNRRRWSEDKLPLLEDGPARLESLLQAAGKCEPKDAENLLSVARKLRKAILDARAELRRLTAIPVDAPAQCRCHSKEHHTLPEWIAVQLVDVDFSSQV